ncbi:MAG: hypothetical protein ACYSX0_00315 [Planctomycetota bacterium]|jgi:hypothetical protein
MRLRKIALWIGLPLLVVVGGYAVWWATLSHRFQSRLDRLRDAGEPTLLAELNPPPVPDSENAAPLLARAHEWYAEHDDREPWVWLPYDRNEWTEDEWQEAAAWVESCAPFIALLEEAAERPECRYELDWSQGIMMKVPSIPVMKEAADTLEVRAALDARAGDGDAYRHIFTIMKLADHIEQQFAIGILVRCTLHGVALEVLQNVAQGAEFDARRARADLDGLFAAAEDREPRMNALKGERAAGLDIIARWLDGESPLAIARAVDAMTGDRDGTKETEDHSAADSVASSWICRPLAYLDGIAFLDFMEQAIDLASDCTPERLAEMEGLYERTREPGLPYLITSLCAPVPYKLLQGELRRLAQVRLARVGLALLEYRQEHREWPEALRELAPRFNGAVPLDPYSGEAIRYERIADGVRIEADAPIPVEELREDDEIVWEMKG